MSIFSFMSRHTCLTGVAVLSAACSAAMPAMAQAVGSVRLDRQPTLQASQSATDVPLVAYLSVFDNLPKGVETTTLDWKAANANVGQFKRGYADLLKWEQEQADKARKTSAVPPNSPAKAQPAPASPSKAGGQP